MYFEDKIIYPTGNKACNFGGGYIRSKTFSKILAVEKVLDTSLIQFGEVARVGGLPPTSMRGGQYSSTRMGGPRGGRWVALVAAARFCQDDRGSHIRI